MAGPGTHARESRFLSNIEMPTSLVIPVFNGLPQLSDCLRSLSWAQEMGVGVVVVDSGSTDGSREVVAALAPRAHVVLGNASMWWTAAVDAGCRYALETLRAERICLLNHDCLWSREGFAALEHALEDHPDSIACSDVVSLDGLRTVFGGGVTMQSGMLSVRACDLPADPPPRSGWVDWCGGQGVLFTALTYRRIGGFDTVRFPHYYGDSDFCLRGAKIGIGTWFCSGSRVWNDTTTTGLGMDRAGTTLTAVLRTLISRRSMFNVHDTVRFYVRHRRLRAVAAISHLYGMWAGVALVRLLRGAR